MTAPQDVPSRPLLRIVRGEPTAQELAALLTVLTARTAPPARPPAARVRSLWGAPVLRGPLSPGPGAWRASGLPR